MELPARIEQKIEYEPNSNCWIWVGAIHPQGYGHITVRRQAVGAHRVVYELLRGPIPEGLTLDHLCRVRSCVNPDHLEPTTIGVNGNRGNGMGALNRRKTHCPKGHPYDFFETGRRCLACRQPIMRAASLRYYYRHRAPRT